MEIEVSDRTRSRSNGGFATKHKTTPTPIRPERIHPLNLRAAAAAGPVLYWMSRDQRATDNWALVHAQQEAQTSER
jgi:hypothetical protein